LFVLEVIAHVNFYFVFNENLPNGRYGEEIMFDLLHRLRLGGSVFALSAVFVTSTALAQDQNTESVEQVTVTGTSIRGVAPPGTNLITLSPDDIAATGAMTVQQALADVPAISGFGNAGEGSSIHNNYYQPSIHQLGASASNATLVLMDGHLTPTGGTNHSTADPNIIPANMLQTVQVIANGDSSIYGSNAVAGVVNFITRSEFNGVQLNAQEDILHGATNFTGGLLVGTTWSGGSVVMGYQYYAGGALNAADRSFSANPNQTALAIAAGLPVSTSTAQTNFDTFTGAGPNCSQSLARINGSGNYYNLATGQQYSTASSSAPCNLAYETDLVQSDKRNNLMLKFKQDVGPNLTLGSDVILAEREDAGISGRGTISAATAFATGAQANPFFQAPPGYTGAPITNESIYANLDNTLGGPGVFTVNGSTDMMGDITGEYRLPWKDFVINAIAVAGRDDSYSRSPGGNVNPSSAYLGLNGTTNPSGSLTQPAVAGTNIIPTNLPLTAANALDVWDTTNNQTSSSVISSILNSRTLTENIASYYQFRLSTNGTAFDLPAGPVKIAMGMESDKFTLEQQTDNANGTGPANLGTIYQVFDFPRSVNSGFVELNVPVIGPDMGIPAMQKFVINASGRYDSYSDVGDTKNYKLAFDWTVIDGLKLRGNMSTSFVAPGLDVVGDTHNAYLGAQYGANTSLSGVPIPVAAYPVLTQFAPAQFSNGQACTLAAGTCTLASTVQGVEIVDGDHTAQPQRGRGWEVGFDFTPGFIPGLQMQATFWNTSFLGGITAPNIGNIVNNAGLNNQLTLYPGAGISQAAVNAQAVGIRQSSALPSPVSYLWYSSAGNILNLYLQGIDASFSYIFDTDWGSFKVGDSTTDFTKYNESYGPGGVPYSILNTTGANTSFSSVGTQSRANLGWAMDNLTADLFINYTGPYRNWSGTSVIPLTKNAQGNPDGGGDPVKANVTFDMHAGYQFNGGMLGDDTLSFTVINIANTAPPFYLGATGYDSWIASPLGREFELGLTAKF
jgi:iron complex outermembrane receptor protein